MVFRMISAQRGCLCSRRILARSVIFQEVRLMPYSDGGECNKAKTAIFVESLSDLVARDFLVNSIFVPPSRYSMQYFHEVNLKIRRNSPIEALLTPRRPASTAIDLFR